MINLFSLKKTKSKLLGMPMLICAIGQSNIFANGGNTGWIYDNYPELMTIKSGVFVLPMNNVYVENKICAGNFLQLKIDVNGLGQNLTLYSQSSRLGEFNGTAIMAIKLNEHYGLNTYFINMGRGGTSLIYSETTYTWNVNQPSNYSLFNVTIRNINIAKVHMDATYGEGNWILIFDWNQGEHGPNVTTEYEKAEWDLYNGFVGIYGNKLQFISQGVKNRTLVNQAKINNSLKTNNFHYYSNDDLPYSSDNTHYNSEGHYLQGVRSFNIIKSLYANL